MCELFSGRSRACWCWWISNRLNICQAVEPWMRYSQWEQTLLSSSSSLNSVFLCLCLYREGNNSLFSIRTHRHTRTSFSVFLTLSLLNHNTSRQTNVLNGRIILTAASSHSLSFLFLLFFFPLQIRTQTTRPTSVSHLACLICNVWLAPPLISHVVCKTPDYKTRSCVAWPRH